MAVTLTANFDIYNEETVKRLQEEDPDILPTYTTDKKKDLAYNKKQVTAAITSAVIQGKSIDKIADDLQTRMTSINRSGAIKTARTAVTSAQNGGTLASMKELAAMGIEVQKEWVATLDDRTRPSHRALDGQRRDLDKTFSNGLQYPGDSSGSSAEVWNCRCTMVSYILEYDSDDEPRVTYSEWEKYKRDTEGAAGNANRNNKNSSVVQNTKSLLSSRSFIDDMITNGIEYRPVDRSTEMLSEDQIINILTVEDYTDGSCASLALAYCGRKQGYDVSDYRGGTSREYFASNLRSWVRSNSVLRALKFDGNSPYEAAVKALANIEEGKEYLLETGTHAAIVRQLRGGNLQYLELQSIEDAGWNDFEIRFDGGNVIFSTLNDRFGCDEAQRNEAVLTDIEKFGEEATFREILGFINT